MFSQEYRSIAVSYYNKLSYGLFRVVTGSISQARRNECRDGSRHRKPDGCGEEGRWPGRFHVKQQPAEKLAQPEGKGGPGEESTERQAARLAHHERNESSSAGAAGQPDSQLKCCRELTHER